MNVKTKSKMCCSYILIVGHLVDPKRSPQYVHSIVKGAHNKYSGQSKNRIDASLSAVKVCCKEAHLVERKLQKEYFSKWNEACNVKEYNGFDLSQTGELIRKISNDFALNQKAINKLRVIKLCRQIDVKFIDFMLEDKFNSGIIHFGMIAISKENNVLDAFSCLYTLNIEKAKELVKKTTTNKILGIRFCKRTQSWSETKSIESVSREDLKNFCRYKALVEFNKRKLISRINDVASLSDI